MNLRLATSCFVISMAACSGAGPGGTGGGSAGNGGGTSGGAGGGAAGGTSSAGGGTATGGGGGSSPDAGVDSWASWASPDFFAVYCNDCHTPGGQGDPSGAHFDFTQYADVATNAALIRCGTAVAQDPAWGCAAFPPAKQFPVGSGPKPTDAERNRLVAWIDAGHPQ